MPEINIEELKEKISKQHEGDERQLEVIFSDSPRVIVEAPAGYGKTTTMISRLAYLFALEKIPNPKRILGLTFSVNAALKVKRDVAEKLPMLIGTPNNPISVGEKATVTNYHGFCKGILKKYGYLISDILRKDVNLFQAIGDSDVEKKYELKSVLNTSEIEYIKSIESLIKNAVEPSMEQIHQYNQIISNKILPHDIITHNAVILFVLEIFEKHKEVALFYRNYYPLVVVDEFQDTNCIAWMLLKSIRAEKTQLLFLGDPLQRIYGFIGALPNIMSKAASEYSMRKIVLSKNYRFRHNPEMLKLDRNIRLNADTLFSPSINDSDFAQLPAFCGETQSEEAQKVVSKVKSLLTEGTKIAILFHSRGKNAEIVESELVNKNIPYFYGMFKDDDLEYIDFHIKCQEQFIKQYGKSRTINKNSLKSFSQTIKAKYAGDTTQMSESLLKLLDALIEKVSVDYSELSPDDKYNLMLDIFENRQLKQSMEYVESNIILSTVHGAKGLEWDYVIICDVEQWVFTFACYDCPGKTINNGFVCKLPNGLSSKTISRLLDDFCVFYVALTRAKRQAYISASAERFNASGKQFTNGKICCFALVKGIKLRDGTAV